MKTSNLPLVCGIALTAISTAGISHWWSVHQFVTAIDAGLPVSTLPAAAPQTHPMPSKAHAAEQPMLARKSKNTPTASPDQKEFYENLIAMMKGIENQHRDLRDQVAETNRDVMKLNFRVDTHSESFRPLPVTEDNPFVSTFNDGPGVLPPRAEAIMLPSQ